MPKSPQKWPFLNWT
ncbi:hypothetical protein F383_00905 [Gossypium arboreum]|uniref:Uncharacterized protein n=1 Tax=Gossypium arboreum TaxID=29729 RepID=A0A0B0PI05_GOSAR|nr:hypothetical protein F383_00905 [Gossypium arboreum]